LSFTSVMLWTSVTSWPRSRNQRASQEATTNGRALPKWARAYTVGPQTYIPIGRSPGSGSSTGPRARVL
jgi:hypothetical protein